uniref:exo-alpha-sialidase n=1 Tax=uncultured Armatimonadetes bacterium TaxID=157466 RepID=A0A6J4IFJ1_9BACT|nr:GH33 [uncultured Armatimonadetes bacterium]
MRTSAAPPVPETSILFDPRALGYSACRIPALVATGSGALLAFCEARRGQGGDWDLIDLLMRRSTNGGATWEPARTLAEGGAGLAGNPTPIGDRNGAVHLLYQRDYGRAFYRRSDDDGATWSAPRDITDVFERFRPEYGWRVLAPGPGHAIQLRSGRLLVPVWLSTGEGAEFGAGRLGHRPSVVATVFSDDAGATWRRGRIVVRDSAEVRNPSESVAMEMQDGRVLLNIRSESPRSRRLVATSPDGAAGWSEPRFHDELFEPVCMASLIRVGQGPGGRNRVLFANPDSRNAATSPGGPGRRENLTIRLSHDDGETWPVSKVLEPGPAGYSDLAAGADGAIFCLYEGRAREGDRLLNTHLSLARFDLNWLTGGGNDGE